MLPKLYCVDVPRLLSINLWCSPVVVDCCNKTQNAFKDVQHGKSRIIIQWVSIVVLVTTLGKLSFCRVESGVWNCAAANHQIELSCVQMDGDSWRILSTAPKLCSNDRNSQTENLVGLVYFPWQGNGGRKGSWEPSRVINHLGRAGFVSVLCGRASITDVNLQCPPQEAIIQDL